MCTGQCVCVCFLQSLSCLRGSDWKHTQGTTELSDRFSPPRREQRFVAVKWWGDSSGCWPLQVPLATGCPGLAQFHAEGNWHWCLLEPPVLPPAETAEVPVPGWHCCSPCLLSSQHTMAPGSMSLAVEMLVSFVSRIQVTERHFSRCVLWLPFPSLSPRGTQWVSLRTSCSPSNTMNETSSLLHRSLNCERNRSSPWPSATSYTG